MYIKFFIYIKTFHLGNINIYIKLFILTSKSFTFKTQFAKHHFYTHSSPLKLARFSSNSRFPSDSPFHIFQEKPQLTINHNFHLIHHTHSFHPTTSHSLKSHVTIEKKKHNQGKTKLPFSLQNDLNAINSNPFLVPL